jgi:hypothetical protein
MHYWNITQSDAQRPHPTFKGTVNLTDMATIKLGKLDDDRFKAIPPPRTPTPHPRTPLSLSGGKLHDDRYVGTLCDRYFAGMSAAASRL